MSDSSPRFSPSPASSIAFDDVPLPRTASSAVPRPRVGTLTLGCKVNQYESESYADAFWLHGFEVGSHADPLDLCIVNTCSVTNMAMAKSRQAIRKIRRRSPNVFLVATGCGTEADSGAVVGVEELDLVIPNLEKDELVDRILSALAQNGRLPLPEPREREDAFRASDRTRALLKVQDGCDYYCSFCIIPFTRGGRRSRPWTALLDEAKSLARRGHRELVITGICVGTYSSQGRGLHDLLRALTQIDGIERIRLSSIEPNDVNGSIAEELATNPRICRHFHIPLQSGDDRILRAMNRHYDSAAYLATIDRLRASLPGVIFTTDLMVGFPGETDEHHQATLRFVERVDFYKLHVFPYSVRQGTRAAEWPDQVPPQVKDARSAELMCWSRESTARKNHAMVGEIVRVLVERNITSDGHYTGLTDTYLRVTFPASHDVRGQMVSVSVTAPQADGVRGELVES